MKRPTNVHADVKRRTSTLFFDDGECGTEFYMRGGICWPMLVESEDSSDVRGFAVMCGLEVKTGVVWVFEEREFLTVEHVVGADGHIEHQGIAPWFAEVWGRYFADTFYKNQRDAMERKHLLEVVRSEWCRKNAPYFVGIEWSAEEEARQLVWRYVKLRRLRMDKGGPLFMALEQSKMDNKTASPEVHALQCVLSGLERHPFREPREQAYA